MSWDPDEEDSTSIFKVIKDSKNQYQVWSLRKKTPVGWKDEGKQGLKEDCIKYIEEVWTDRPFRRIKK